MRRALGLVAIAAAAAFIAAAGTAAVQEAPGRASTSTPPTATTPIDTPAPLATSAAGAAAPAPSSPAAAGPTVLLAWAQAPGITAAAIEAAAAVPGVRAVAVVRDGRTDLVRSFDADGAVVDELEDGWRIPLETIAVDPDTFAEVVPKADGTSISELGPGEAVLGETSAELRRLGAGSRVELVDGTVLTVAAVVPDQSVGAAELVVDETTGRQLGIDIPRAVLVAHETDRAAVEEALTAAMAGTPVRFRAPGETPFLRAADSVLPQSLVKAAFGEFAYRPLDGDRVELDPEWIDAAIVEDEVPVLGTVRCHRAIIGPLTDAMEAIELAGLGDEVAGMGYDGCFVRRFIRSGSSLSRHAWGIAFDIGFSENRTRAHPDLDDRIVALLQHEGFTWGGTWLSYDGAHFEMVRPEGT